MFAHCVLAGLAFAVAAVAQTQRLAFTTFPTLEGVTVGQPFTLRWQGGDGTVSLPTKAQSRLFADKL